MVGLEKPSVSVAFLGEYHLRSNSIALEKLIPEHCFTYSSYPPGSEKVKSVKGPCLHKFNRQFSNKYMHRQSYAMLYRRAQWLRFPHQGGCKKIVSGMVEREAT